MYNSLSVNPKIAGYPKLSPKAGFNFLVYHLEKIASNTFNVSGYIAELPVLA